MAPVTKVKGLCVTQASVVLSVMVFAIGIGSLLAKRLRCRAAVGFGMIEAALALIGGSSALVPCGTTGENSTLSNAEHHRVIEVCVEQAAGRVPVIAGCGSNDTMNALLHMNFSRKSGAKAALLVAQRRLPLEMTELPAYRKVNPADAPILFMHLTSPSMDLSELNDYAENLISPAISTVPSSGVPPVTSRRSMASPS